MEANVERRVSNPAEMEAQLASAHKTLLDWDKLDRIRSKLCCIRGFVLPVVLAATTGSLLFGVNTSVLNTSVDYIASDFQWCVHAYDTGCDQARWYKALTNTGVFAGAALGAIASGALGGMGPRQTILLTGYIFFVGVVASVVANGFSSLLWARIIVGFGVGVTSAATPTYISEMTPPASRGNMGVMHQLMLVSGQFVGVLLGLAFQLYPTEPGDGEPTPSAEQLEWSLSTFDKVWWRFMLGTGMIPAVIAMALFIPIFPFETPAYYIKRGQDGDAVALLQRINGRDDVETDYRSLKNQLEQETSKKLKFTDALKKKGYQRALWVGVALSVFQQITGVNAFVSSSSKMFGEAGIEGRTKTLAAVGLSSVPIFAAFIPLFLLDRVGRRTLLIIGAIGMAISTAPATILFYVQQGQDSISSELSGLAIAGAYIFLLFFSFSAGPITWVYLFEIFPMDMKSAAAPICVAANWLGSIVMVFGGSFLETKISYTIFTVCSVAYIVFIIMFVRETRGLRMGESPFVPNAGEAKPGLDSHNSYVEAAASLEA